MNTELTLKQAKLAWRQGKKVLAAWGPDGERLGKWGLIYNFETGIGEYWPVIFNKPAVWRFRLAPELPAKKWRPWNMLEVPVGVLLKQKQANFKAVLIEFDGNDRIVAGRERVMSRNGCFENYEHSIDGGKTWLPCGVEVSE